MNSEWKRVKLGEIGVIITGKTPPSQQQDCYGSEYLFLTPRDMSTEKYIRNTERYLSTTGIDKLKGQVISGKSVCVSCIGSDMGKVVLTDKVCVTNQQINSITKIDSVYDPEFVYYSLKLMKDFFHKIAGGSTMPIINKTSFSNIEINVPEKSEQTGIVAVLASIDKKIELNNSINKNLEEMAQAIFKRWFVDFEFPNERGEPYKTSGGEFEESELGLIPKGWRVGLLSELGEVVGGATPSKNKEEYYTTQGIPWITPKDLSINKNKYISRGQIDITEDGFKNSSTKLVPKGTILFSSRAPIGYIAISKNEMTTNQGFKSLIPFKHIGTEFLYYVLKFNTEMIESRASGSTFKEISGSEMKRIPVLIPISRVIEQFNEVVEPLGKLVEKCESENDSLILLRDSLLPKLMSGEIRVPLEQEYVGTASLPMAAENKAQYSTT
ncbi:restriction endonuclease subunit S [Brevibacillus panacihumi]|uniref:restriction endonuclease subunit S n=1 Tax=Brevibacillus panacihumi TaxID=497735 RepID=UPI003D20A53D